MPKYIEEIIKEIKATEEAYVHHLDIVTKFFSVPLLERELLSTEAHSTIFGQLPAIYSINKWLLEELKFCEENIGTIFIKFGPFLKAYSSYASNFQKSLSVLQECESKSDELHKFINCTETRPEVQLKLSALLITPIQRIPRYKLLLVELLKHIEDNEELYTNIKKALVTISNVADHLNHSLDDVSMLQRLLIIQKSFSNQSPSIIIPGRRIIKEGCLNKVSKNGSSTQIRIFFLFSDVLIYAKATSRKLGKAFKSSKSHLELSELKPNSLDCCCVLPIRYCQITKLFGSSDQGVTFRLQCQSEDVVLYSNNAKEADSWIEAIRISSKNAISKRSTLRKVSSNEKTERNITLRKLRNSNGLFSPNCSLLSQLRSTVDCVPSPKIWLQNRRNPKRKATIDKSVGKRTKIS